MGFDLDICLNVWLDEETGLPFVWGKGLSKLPYVPSDYEVPLVHRRYLSQRGHHFHAYIKGFDGYTTDVNRFLENYPEWSEVAKHLEGRHCYDDWTETDHTGFKQALEWMDTKGIFGIHWSY